MPLAALSDDVLGRILVQLPDFDTLYCAIRSYKRLNVVYRKQRASVIREVAYNFMGPAYTAARKVFYHKTAPESMFGNNPMTHDDEHIANHFPTFMTREYIEFLEEHAHVVCELENLYSTRSVLFYASVLTGLREESRHKDRKSKTSVLRPSESLSFQRGIYNLWAYSVAVDDVVYSYDEDDFGSSDEYDFEPLPLPEDFYEKELGRLSYDELCELGNVYLFLTEVLAWRYTRLGRRPADGEWGN